MTKHASFVYDIMEILVFANTKVVCSSYDKAFAMIFRVTMGIAGDHAFMAKDRVVAPVGLNMVALVVQRHVLPFFVDLAAIHKVLYRAFSVKEAFSN
ncbi:translation initiation factor eIF-2B subunit beta [Artemisia annua]|uniref:Translation initiation factor eIF-2B subunit beta n=1 Tax=Artemisia annua TaxID=35608 RepID=A0A2U1NRC7_ARTAN|nr:translation initiation factor eIF-2B subunit beta [Artemisia annua]